MEMQRESNAESEQKGEDALDPLGSVALAAGVEMRVGRSADQERETVCTRVRKAPKGNQL